MVNATLPHNEYASIEDGNHIKVDFVRAIFQTMRMTHKTPKELAGDEWRHWKLKINAPHECYRQVVCNLAPDMGLVAYGSALDGNKKHHRICQEFLETGSDYEDPPDEVHDRESDAFKESQARFESEFYSAQLDSDARVSQPKKDWINAHRDAVAQYQAGRWDTIPYRSRYNQHDDDFLDPDEENFENDGTYTEQEHEAWRHRHEENKYTEYFPNVPWS